MAVITTERWEPSWEAASRRDRRAGTYGAYVPDGLAERPLVLDGRLAARAGAVEAKVRALAAGPGARSLEGVARFLLRSEAIASSRIEGLQVSAQQVALAELAQDGEGPVRGFTRNAALVANNITALRRAATDLADAATVTVDDIDDLHRALFPDERRQGIRQVQNWIGGSDYHPLDADYVPPPWDRLRPLMTDLADYINGAAHGPLVQASLVHAQFETIHPYTDGNGRVGRALIHTVLTRRGLTRVAVLPISLVLLTRSDAYVGGLTSYRYRGPVDGVDARAGVSAWLEVFLDAVEVAVTQADTFAEQLEALAVAWSQQLFAHRERLGLRAAPRSTSAVARLVERLPEVPLLTTATARRLLGVSSPAARAGLEELADAGILHRKQVERGTTGYLARDVFELLTIAERRLASTRWDTRRSEPARPVPSLPQT